MSDVVAQHFEVGQSTLGAANVQAWIAANITGSLANKLLAIVPYKVENKDFVVLFMSTTKVSASPATAMTNPKVAEFELKEHSFAPMVTWMNAQTSTVLQKVAVFERGHNQVYALVVLSN